MPPSPADIWQAIESKYGKWSQETTPDRQALSQRREFLSTDGTTTGYTASH